MTDKFANANVDLHNLLNRNFEIEMETLEFLETDEHRDDRSLSS
jgi:hypothetical protein